MEQSEIILKIRAFLSGVDTSIINEEENYSKPSVFNEGDESKRRSYSKTDVEATWEMYHGNSSEDMCLLCNINRVIKDDRSTWEMSHIESHSSGGSSELKNIRPLCFTCNRSMGSMSLDKFVIERYPERYHVIYRRLKLGK